MSPRTPPRLLLDHLVIAAGDLDRGAAHVADALGRLPQGGGQHVTMGTHNRLLNLGDALAIGPYLEVIAIDPTLAAPAQARWFGLDVAALRARIAGRPALIAWVVRVEGAPDAIDALHARAPSLIGAPQPFARGDLRWRMAVPGPLDGADTRRFDGLFPVFIQWDVPVHPSTRLPPSDARLVELSGVHPRADAVRAALEPFGLDAMIRLDTGADTRLAARIATAAGVHTLQ